MNAFLILVAVALGVLAVRQERNLETANAELERAREQIEDLQRVVVRARRLHPDLVYHDPSWSWSAGDVPSGSSGDWIWVKGNTTVETTDAQNGGSGNGASR